MRTTPTAHREAVAAEVRAWMGRRRATQADLAAALGKSQPYVSRRLSGEVPFDTDDLYALADLLDAEVTDFLARPKSEWFTADDVRSMSSQSELADVA